MKKWKILIGINNIHQDFMVWSIIIFDNCIINSYIGYKICVFIVMEINHCFFHISNRVMNLRPFYLEFPIVLLQ